MTQLLNKILNRKDASKEDAKQRLKVLLIHDQVDLTPAQLDAMQEEITAVIQKYVEIDRDNSVVRLERGDDRIALDDWCLCAESLSEHCLLKKLALTSPSPGCCTPPKSPKQHSGAAIFVAVLQCRATLPRTKGQRGRARDTDDAHDDEGVEDGLVAVVVEQVADELFLNHRADGAESVDDARGHDRCPASTDVDGADAGEERIRPHQHEAAEGQTNAEDEHRVVPTVPRNTKASAMPTVMPTMTCVRRPPKKRSDAHPANRTPTNPTQSNMVESVPAIAGESAKSSSMASGDQLSRA